MRFYGFGGVEFLFKTFKCAYSKHSLSYLRHTLMLDVGQKITNIQSTYHIFNTLNLVFYLGRIMGFYESGLLGISVIL